MRIPTWLDRLYYRFTMTRLGNEIYQWRMSRGDTLYFCPTSREVESWLHGGFNYCCNHPGCPSRELSR